MMDIQPHQIVQSKPVIVFINMRVMTTLMILFLGMIGKSKRLALLTSVITLQSEVEATFQRTAEAMKTNKRRGIRVFGRKNEQR